MDIQGAYDIIHKIAQGFEDNALQCLGNHSDIIIKAIQEQIYSGLNGEGEHLSPTYDDDPYFEEKGPWYHRADKYKAWKKDITPPESKPMLGLPPRPENVPNLYVNGSKFYDKTTATIRDDTLYIDPGNEAGPAIVTKYGDSLLDIGDTAVAYFNREYMWPAIEKFFNDCGYR